MRNDAIHSHIHALAELRDRVQVFRDRADAGAVLAGMLEPYRKSDALVLVIPAGGVPVAAEIATCLGLALDVAPVSKILFPWTTESGFGAVAFDGTEWINEDIVRSSRLDAESIRAATEKARDKVQRRIVKFRGTRPFPRLHDRTVILVDDGIAAGSTTRAAVLALTKAGAGKIIVTTPTAHDTALHPLAQMVDAIYCANVRSGLSFAVADAYRRWTDVSDDEVMEILARMQMKQ
ncbi:MAG: phosphoribosyltransferase [Gammaproteobacteria bacterium]